MGDKGPLFFEVRAVAEGKEGVSCGGVGLIVEGEGIIERSGDKDGAA